MTSDSDVYPVRFEVQRDAAQNRITNLPLGIGMTIRAILLIPHLIILYFFGIVGSLLYLIASFAILFTGVYPKGMYDVVVSYMRWNARANAYLLSFFDKYPPFTSEEDGTYPLRFTTEYPATSSRLLNFPFFGLIVKVLLLIPHFVIVTFLGIALFVVLFIAHFAILFTGSFPEGMHSFCVGVSRWSTRLSAYMFGLTDRYPPFSTN